MAIEGKDWWIVGGAAAGGAILGAFGAKAIRKTRKEETSPRTLVAHKEYLSPNRDEDNKQILWFADVYADFSKGGYTVLFDSFISGPSFTIPETFSRPTQAMYTADMTAAELEFKDEGDWIAEITEIETWEES